MTLIPGLPYGGYPSGGSGGRGGGAGGGTSGPGGVPGPGQVLLVGSNGGVLGTAQQLFVPGFDITSGLPAIYSFDPTQGYDDPNSPSIYSYKIEEVVQGRTPTLNFVIITYRDLGPVNVVVTATGTTDAQGIVSNFANPTLGNQVPTGVLMTKIVGLSLTAQNLQVTISRASGAGPLSLVKVKLTGRVEIQRY